MESFGAAVNNSVMELQTIHSAGDESWISRTVDRPVGWQWPVPDSPNALPTRMWSGIPLGPANAVETNSWRNMAGHRNALYRPYQDGRTPVLRESVLQSGSAFRFTAPENSTRNEKLKRSTLSLLRNVQHAVGAAELVFCILELTNGDEQIATKSIAEGPDVPHLQKKANKGSRLHL